MKFCCRMKNRYSAIGIAFLQKLDAVVSLLLAYHLGFGVWSRLLSVQDYQDGTSNEEMLQDKEGVVLLCAIIFKWILGSVLLFGAYMRHRRALILWLGGMLLLMMILLSSLVITFANGSMSKDYALVSITGFLITTWFFVVIMGFLTELSDRGLKKFIIADEDDFIHS